MATGEGACLSNQGYTEGEKIRLSGVKTAALIRKGAAVANAIDNAAQLIENRRHQRDISDRATHIAEEEQGHLENTYWPRELNFLKEFGVPEQRDNAEMLGRRYAGRLIAGVSRHFAEQLKRLRCDSSRYCTGARSKAMQDIMLSRAQAIANAKIIGRLKGFAEVQKYADRDWERRKDAVGMSKGLMGQAAQLYERASQGYEEIGQELSGQLSSAIEAFQMAGRDPGRSAEMNSVLQQYRNNARMPGVVNNQGSANRIAQGVQSTYNSFAPVNELQSVTDSTQYNESVSTGVETFSSTNPQSDYASGIRENQMNKGRMGNWDLSRNGSKTYEFTDSDGDRGSITVKMEDFPLVYTDNMKEGDT